MRYVRQGFQATTGLCRNMYVGKMYCNIDQQTGFATNIV